uniref:Tudor domain-containing protein n=1 Tax=Anopheles albimanus TaxID=7167 RepID=A0A182FAU5_ANOAL
MENENFEIDKSTLRVIFDPKEVNLRSVVKQNKQCKKVYIPPDNDALAIVSYTSPDILLVDHELETVVSKITAEQKMRYYTEQKPPTAAKSSPIPLMKLEVLNKPANFHQDRNHPSQQQGDLQQQRPSEEPGEKQQNNRLMRQDSGKENDETVVRQVLQRENGYHDKYQQKEKHQQKETPNQKHPQQESPQRQSQQADQLHQKQPLKEVHQIQANNTPQQKPKQRESQQKPKQREQQQKPEQESQKQSQEEPIKEPPQNQPQQPPAKDQQQLLNKLPLRALVAKAKEDGKRKVLQQGSFPSVGSAVKIAHVAENTMFLFEAGSGSTGPSSQYLKVVERCFVGGEAAQKYLIHAPVAGDIVYAPFEEVYYRAEVKSVKGDEAIVFFTEFGNTESLEWKKFKEIEDPEVKYADRLIHEVQIENLPTFTDFVRTKLQALEGEEFGLSKVVDIPNSKAKMVELRHSKELYYLSEMMLKLSKDNDELKKKHMASPVENVDRANQAVVPPDPKSYVPVSIAELSEVCIPYGDGIELMIIDAGEVYDDASHRLAVIDIERNDAFANVLAEVCKYGEADSNVYSPEELHHLCLVQWEGIWSRAVPLAVGSKEEASSPYCLLDLGIIKAVESSHVRRFPQALSRKLYVADCIVQNPDTLCKLGTGGVQNTELLTGKMIKVNVAPKKNASDEIQEILIISVS